MIRTKLAEWAIGKFDLHPSINKCDLHKCRLNWMEIIEKLTYDFLSDTTCKYNSSVFADF